MANDRPPSRRPTSVAHGQQAPATDGDPGATLADALDHLNSCAWNPGDRKALRAARQACADLRKRADELEVVDRSFSSSIVRFFEGPDGRGMMDDRLRASWATVWHKLTTMRPDDRADFLALGGLLTRAIHGGDEDEVAVIDKGMLEILQDRPARALAMRMGEGRGMGEPS